MTYYCSSYCDLRGLPSHSTISVPGRCRAVSSRDSGASGISAGQFDELMSAVCTTTEAALDTKLAQLKRKLSSEQEEAHDRLAKRVKADKFPEFKKKAQYRF